MIQSNLLTIDVGMDRETTMTDTTHLLLINGVACRSVELSQVPLRCKLLLTHRTTIFLSRPATVFLNSA